MRAEKKVHIFSYLWPPLIVAIIIFYLSCLLTPSDVPEVDIHFPIPTDKIVHFCMYFGLSATISFNYIYRNNGRIIILKLIIFGILTPILYGGLLEILQANYFNREGDWMDFLANSIGSICTIPFSLWLKKHLLIQEYIKDNY